MFSESSFGLTRVLDCSHDEANERIRASLAKHGFGVLTEIDFAGTMKKKLNKDMVPYRILGACHPQSAWDASQIEASIGLLLPCNVVVTENAEGKAVIAAINPDAMFKMVDAEGMEAIVEDVRARLQGAIDEA